LERLLVLGDRSWRQAAEFYHVARLEQHVPPAARLGIAGAQRTKTSRWPALLKAGATLIDLSQPMLDRARERVSRATAGRITTVQGDIRAINLPDGQFDIILAAAVLHHLRTDLEWRDVFVAFHRALRPGGSVWVFDLVESSIPAVGRLMRRHYGEYLTGLKDEAYRDHVFAYVEKEDTPRPLLFQLDLLRQVGFAQIEVLHKNVCFAAFGAVKG
jgi:tRNA (cmo5U34)-methyltransferase